MAPQGGNIGPTPQAVKGALDNAAAAIFSGDAPDSLNAAIKQAATTGQYGPVLEKVAPVLSDNKAVKILNSRAREITKLEVAQTGRGILPCRRCKGAGRVPIPCAEPAV